MDYELEKHLRDMGLLPKTLMEHLEDDLHNVYYTLAKGYFDDPRDKITGDVPF